MSVAVLTIAGSDSSGGAGIQADIKTFSALGVYATSVVTALTAQNTIGVQGVHEVAAEFVAQQIKSVCTDIEIKATKLGMLANADIVAQVCKSVDEFSLSPLVLDPVMVAQSGDRLLSATAVDSIKAELIPRATIITPNLHEAAVLLDCSMPKVLADPQNSVRQLLALGCSAVLLKGGHAHDTDSATSPNSQTPHKELQKGPQKGQGSQDNDTKKEVTDYLATATGITLYNKDWVPTTNTHGSGCTLAAAITAYLARGLELKPAVAAANKFIDQAIKQADLLKVNRHGQGNGPVHHCHSIWN